MARGPKAKTAANSKPIKGQKVAKLQPPKTLDKAGKVEFKRLVNVLQARGTLDRADVRVVEMAADIYSQLIKARADIDRDGLTIQSGNGTPMPHPMLGVSNALRMRLAKLYVELGLTPASSKHGGQTAGKSSQSDPWEGLLGVVG